MGEASDSKPQACSCWRQHRAVLFSLNFHGGLPYLGESDRIKPSHIEQTSLEKTVMHKTLMLPFVALYVVGCSVGGGGLSAEQRATAQVQADQLCQVKQRDPDAYEYAFQMNKIAIGHDDGSPPVAIARETMKIAKAKGCIT